MNIIKGKRISGTPILFKTGEATILQPLKLTDQELKESWFQQMIAESPSVIPVDDIEPAFSPLITIGREVRTNSGPIDLLFISPSGYLTIVETKLWRNPQARREVVAQILDYAKDVSKWTFDNLDDQVKRHAGKSLLQLLHDHSNDDLDEKVIIDKISRNMRLGRFLLLIVGDGIQENVEELIEYVSQSPQLQYALALVELRVFSFPGDEHARLIMPQVVTRTKEVTRGIFKIEGTHIDNVQIAIKPDHATDEANVPSSPGQRITLSEKDFFEELEANTSKEVVQFAKEIIQDFTTEITYIEWLSSSFSIRYSNDISPDADLSILNVSKKGTFNVGRSRAAFQQLGLNLSLSATYANEIAALVGATIHPTMNRFEKDVSLAKLHPVYHEAKAVIDKYIDTLIAALRG